MSGKRSVADRFSNFFNRWSLNKHIASDDREFDLLRTRPRIGITGSFGRGNYGDELYVKTYQHWMGSWADLFMFAGLPRQTYFRTFAENFVDVSDSIILGGGDLLCPYRPQIDRDFVNPLYLRRPVHIAGIGVERNRPDIDPTVVDRW